MPARSGQAAGGRPPSGAERGGPVRVAKWLDSRACGRLRFLIFEPSGGRLVRDVTVRFGAAIALLVALLAGAARADVRRLVIVHTNDLHGQLYAGPDYLT